MRHTLLSIALISILSLLFVPQTASAIETGPQVGKLAPEFELPDLAGKKVSLAGFKGKVVLLNFWATWCATCTAELPALAKLDATFKDQGFLVLTVSLDGRTDPVRDFLRKKGLSLAVLMDSEKEASFDLYAVTALPVSFLIDRDGLIVEKYLGERDWNSGEIKKRISGLLPREKKP